MVYGERLNTGIPQEKVQFLKDNYFAFAKWRALLETGYFFPKF